MTDFSDTPKEITATLNETVVGTKDAITLAKPSTGRIELNTQSQATYSIAFNPDDANLALSDSDLIFTFNDGSQLVLSNFIEATPLPTILLSDGTILAGDVIISQLQDPTSDVFNLETAAGPNSGGEGQFSYDDNFGDGIDLINSLPPVPFTDLIIAAAIPDGFDSNLLLNTDLGDPEGENEVVLFDETDGLSESISGVLDFSFGADGAGSLNGNGAFSSNGSQTANTLSSGGEPITVSFENGVYTGVNANGETVFTLTINSDGSYNFELIKPLDHADGSNSNDTINLNFGYEVTDADGETSTATIAVVVADDAPLAVNDTAIVGLQIPNNDDTSPLPPADGSSTSVGETVVGNALFNDSFGQDGAGNLTEVTFESTTVTFATDSQTDATGAFIEIEGEFGTLIIRENGSYLYTANNEPRDGEAPFVDEFDYTIVDNDGDTSTATLSVDATNVVIDLGDPSANDEAVFVDETDGLSQTLSGELDFDFGADGVGSIAATGGFSVTGSLSDGTLASGGEQINVTFDADTGLYTGSTVGGETVFTLVINSDGSYAFDLFGTLDHGNPDDSNDIIDLNFNYAVTDADGEVSNATLTISVGDDGPQVETLFGSVDETNGFPQSVTGSIASSIDFGEDGAGSMGANGVFRYVAGSGNDVITSGGEVVTVTFNADTGTYTGATASGETIFTMTISSADGSYEFELFGTLDHPDTSNPNDGVGLWFGYEATDSEGDVSGGSSIDDVIRITVFDDRPLGDDAFGSLDETDGLSQTLEGTINVDFGEDGAAPINGSGDFSASGSLLGGTLTSGGEVVTVSFENNLYTGVTAGGETVFTLVINEDGSYTFNLLGTLDHADGANPNDIIELSFGYSTTDFDGDPDTEAVIIQIFDDVPLAVDDSQTLASDQLVVTGSVVANDDYGEDGTGNLTQITFEGQTLSFAVDGQTDSNGNTFIEIEADFGTLIIFEDGSYTYTVDPGQLDNGPFIDEFDYTIVDADGDTSTATLTIDANDVVVNAGAPNAQNESGVVNEDVGFADTLQSLSGELEFDFGPDGGGSIDGTGVFSASGSVANNVLASNGDPVTVTYENGVYTGATADGNVVFTLTINDDGSYDFSQFARLDHAEQDFEPLVGPGDNTPTPDVLELNFQYQVTDADGDTSTANIEIQVIDDTSPFISISNSDFPVVEQSNIVLGESPATATGLNGGGETTFILRNVNPNVENFNIRFNGEIYDTSINTSDGDVFQNETTLTRGGEPLSYTVSEDGLTLSAHDNEGNLVFNMIIDPNYIPIEGSQFNDAEFSYTFELYLPMDDDSILTNIANQFRIGIDTTDSDGDGVESWIQIAIREGDPQVPDIDLGDPQAITTRFVVDETDGLLQTIEGELNFDFGADGSSAEGVISNGTFFADGNGLPNALSSNGQLISVTLDNGVYNGITPDGELIFALQINTDGSYEFNLYGPLDHNNPLAPNEGLHLNFGYEVSDADGETASATLIIVVQDDIPVAVDDTGVFLGGTKILTGNVLANDDFGADGPGEITQITFENVLFTFADDGQTDADGNTFIEVNGQYGLLTIYTDGSYEYDYDGTQHTDSDPFEDAFDYTIVDADGDASTATLTIDLTDIDSNSTFFNAPDVTQSDITRFEDDQPLDLTADNTQFVDVNDTLPDITQSDPTRFDDYTLPEFMGDDNPLVDVTHPDITQSDITRFDDYHLPERLENEESNVFYDETANTLDISDLLSDSGYEPGVSDIGHFIQVEENGEVHVDVTGTGNFDTSNVVANVDGVSTFDTINVVFNDDEGDIPVQII